MERCYTIEDLRRRAWRRVPHFVSDFVDGAAEDEVTLRRNRAAFENLELIPRYLVDVGERDLTTTVLGTRMASPLVLGPSGSNRLAHPEGELAVARAAHARGNIFTLSIFGSQTLEDVAVASQGSVWFQVYLWKDRKVTEWVVKRARQAGVKVLILTIDCPVLGQRERDLRNQTKVPVKVTWGLVRDVLRHPLWGWSIARYGIPGFASMRGVPGAEGARDLDLITYVNQRLFDSSQTWKDVAWLRSIWDGPLAIKGILHPDDARLAVEHGANGVVVSNHGGRQLDGAPATIDMLPGIVEAVGDSVDVLIDGGFRRGTDIVKALALGADAVMFARPYWYGLGAGGEAGVSRTIEILTQEIDRTLALLGVTRAAELDHSVIRRRTLIEPPTEVAPRPPAG